MTTFSVTLFGMFVEVCFGAIIILLWIGIYRLDLALRLYFWLMNLADRLDRIERDDWLKRLRHTRRVREDREDDAA